MATIYTTRKDNERFVMDGHRGRFILPSDPKLGGCTSWTPEGRGTIHQFDLKDGALSDNEARSYAGQLQNASERAMLTFEGDGAIDRFGKVLKLTTKMNLLPGPTITARLWALIQWNQGLGPGEGRYRSPGAAIGLEAINGKEFFTFDVHTLDAPPGDMRNGTFTKAAPSVPAARRQHNFEVHYMDGRCGPGLFKVWIDGALVCNYAGPTGYKNYGSPYLGAGIYRIHQETVPMSVRFEGLTEGILA